MDISLDSIGASLASNSTATGGLTALHLGGSATPASGNLYVDGDTVDISSLGRVLASGSSTSAAAANAMNLARQSIAESIATLRSRLGAALSDSGSTPEQRAQSVQELQTEVLLLQNQQLLTGGGVTRAGGTPAAGIGDSVGAFSS